MRNPKKNGTVFYLIGYTTVCLLMKDGVAVARGVGVHSCLDRFDPKEGRDYAISRAKEALNRQSDCGEIMLDAPRGNPYDWFSSSIARDLFGSFKGYYNPTLTETETRLLAKGCSRIDNAEKLRVIPDSDYEEGGLEIKGTFKKSPEMDLSEIRRRWLR